MKRAWVLRTALDRMRQEADAKFPLETGGMLIGYCSADDADVVVTGMVGPGPNAIHRRSRFVPDYTYHHQEIKRIYDDSCGMITYLGDWHSHPKDHPYLSMYDRRALRNIARFPENYVERPVMLVLGGIDDGRQDGWTAAAWRISPLKRLLWPLWEYLRLEIHQYEDENTSS